ncbi:MULTISPECIES: DNA repair protein RadA [Aliarcobacter]|jgi:DNA repair protein RadA/Sms|uniref:DNA repair protein RadA n=2 Tax=Aliarcobacter skirrowii TaxID=28200 RepID=A0A2U2BZF1_9BACT|nr:DNA repair protein RadA [Aliarcobacter skirrowii]AXX85065.1 DNA repair and recombination protein [Aliarcobacter skirrowii CCUG 10374]AZL54144.1 DNA repair protein RadA [Aliarcobacter skirrowii]KAB0620773.1 DNA repair protein RadA [Aliarcobacter skirrowii CCUG 10374]MCT7446882.1 DNA repair protein RadA [Aliarcobacter skirrowii]MDD3025183.1 DNA repair protein RadA [Aliarcobacter skirrowii]
MAKKKNTLFECQHCGEQSSKWLGKCPNCDSWDSFLELNADQQEVLKQTIKVSSEASKARPITDIKQDDVERFSSFNYEFDLVLGGGVVPGSLTLIGGSPGVGKSTLLLKVAGSIAKSGKKVLYVSGEESAGQIKLRANRLDANSENLFLLSEIKLEEIMDELLRENYEVCIIDSIQTIYSSLLNSSPGSVSQVREITFELMRKAKESNIAMFIIGHITKDGSIAGPRVLEHMVDTVLYFEGEASRELRMLRGFKNRFGSTSEIGIFEMTAEGLISAKDIASKFFDKNKSQSGSSLTVSMEGSRAIILEVQALVTESTYPNPKRSATGFDANRLTMLLALLEKKLDLPLNNYDVFVNISGGIKIKESSADLAVIASIISSFRNRPISKESVFIGEVSLTGEIKDVYSLDIRLKEASAQGIKKAVVAQKIKQDLGIKVFAVDEVSKMIELF